MTTLGTDRRWRSLLEARNPRRLRTALLVGAVPVVVAIGSWLTNVLTSGWDPWLFAALAGVVTVSAVLTVAAERNYSLPAPVPAVPAPAGAPPAWVDVPPRSRHFTGRQELLTLLAHRPAESHGVTAIVPHALYGLGGVGKTHLAVEYAHRRHHQFDLVAWIPAEQPAALRSAYLRVAAAMGLPESDDVERTLALVRDGLRRGVPFRRWLMIFDNAEGPATLQAYLPEPAPPHSTGQVLITSRDRGWSGVADTIEVEVLHRDESVALLRKRNPVVDEADAVRLAEQLGDLPLALEQASAWIDASGTTLPHYLRLLSERTRDLLDANRPADYPASVAATWGVALERLSTTDSAAVRLLELTAFLAPEPVDRGMLRLGGGGVSPTALKEVLTDPLRLDQAMAHIGRLSLAKLDAGRGTIQLHRLMRAVVQAQVSPDRVDELRAAAQSLLATAEGAAGDETDPQTWAMHGRITPHLRFTGCLSSTNRQIQELVLRQLSYLHNRGDMKSCRDFAEEARDRWSERAGPDDENTLFAAFWLAGAARGLGDIGLSKVLLEEILGRARRSLGNDHPVTLRAANSYGANLRLAGDYRRAYQSDLLTLERCRVTYGPTGFWTAAVSNNLAIDLRNLGRFAEALAQNEETHALRLRTLGPGHLTTLFSQAACALDLYYLGRYQECLDIAETVIPLMKPLVESPDMYFSPGLRIQVIALTAAGEHAKAAALSRPLLDAYRTVRGVDHPDTIAIAMTTVNALRAGHPAESLTLVRATLALHQKVYGDDHPATLAALVNTAVTERRNGEYAAAAHHDEQAAGAVENVFGVQHWVTLCAGNGRAINHAIAGDHATSCRMLKQTYDTSVLVRGAGHPYTLACSANLAKANRRAGKWGAGLTPPYQLRRHAWAECPVELPLY
ncbi:tetratricopeptide (TPR) repeat protein [Actinoplanes lutulentus]|uniref:FxSxx-COOH system tetratricopeptide repeat protein n=1 Tax=Actinoplanes lutulentus TaxID=1287878 RepID=UPI0015EBF131|nr:FxSxx-COOH system tetratricopeptide repeat protein [Actinoplanes lutulentus]MBB2948696.1 tetratricopeptide (TPR) repeat protein [Actinoplanes lutulentus]